MSFGIEILSPSGRGVLLDGDEGFAAPVSRGYATVTTERVYSSDPTYSYVYCNLVVPLTGYDPNVHALAYSVSAEDAETLNVSHVYFNYARGAFSLSITGQSLNLSYRNPPSGNATIYDPYYWPYTVRFRVYYELVLK
jgi:hypothetical protein